MIERLLKTSREGALEKFKILIKPITRKSPPITKKNYPTIYIPKALSNKASGLSVDQTDNQDCLSGWGLGLTAAGG